MIKPKTVEIGSKKCKFTPSAAVVLNYKQTFGKDVFTTLDNYSKGESDMADVFELAFCMSDAYESDKSFKDWLSEFELLDFVNAAGEILTLFTSSISTEGADSKNQKATEK